MKYCWPESSWLSHQEVSEGTVQWLRWKNKWKQKVLLSELFCHFSPFSGALTQVGVVLAVSDSGSTCRQWRWPCLAGGECCAFTFRPDLKRLVIYSLFLSPHHLSVRHTALDFPLGRYHIYHPHWWFPVMSHVDIRLADLTAFVMIVCCEGLPVSSWWYWEDSDTAVPGMKEVASFHVHDSLEVKKKDGFINVLSFWRWEMIHHNLGCKINFPFILLSSLGL